MKKDNLILVGMPGSGKSIVGKLLAKKINFKFIDCDEYIVKKEKKSLQQIIDTKGDKGFLKIEEKRILELFPLKNYILAPGGSIVYIKKVMKILKDSSVIIFLDLPLKTIEQRLTNKEIRGIVGFSLKPIKKLYCERLPLYKKYADITISCSLKSNSQIIKKIINNLPHFIIPYKITLPEERNML